MIAALPRTVLSLSPKEGAGLGDVVAWLDGLLTNTVRGDGVSFAALLTPQGKIIADMFVTPDGDRLLLDTTPEMGLELKKRLAMYVLRAPVAVEDVSGSVRVYRVWDTDQDMGMDDPRHASAGRRRLGGVMPTDASEADWDAFRLSLGLPDSQFDFGPGEVFPADADMDELHGVDYRKGCFIGQEVVSRMHRMSTVKKRMRAVILSAEAKDGDVLKAGERRVGDVLHVRGKMGMALVRLERLAAAQTGLNVNGEPAEVMAGPNG